MSRCTFLKNTSATIGAVAVTAQLSKPAAGQAVEGAPTFRRPKVILPVPTPSPQFQHLQAGVPDTQLTREATGLLREFSTPLLVNHSQRAFFWANELGRKTGRKFDVDLLFVCAAFHNMSILKKFSSATDRFEVDSANAVRQFLELSSATTSAATSSIKSKIPFSTIPKLTNTAMRQLSMSME